MKNLFILPTDKPSRLHSYKGVLNLAADEFVAPTIVKNDLINQNIYITNDEEIKDCWVLNTHINEVYFLKGFYGIQPITKKIILTTDQDLIKDGVQPIDYEFLKWFVKNPSCEEVEIEYQTTGLKNGVWQYDYKIIIPKEEPKQETLEDVIYQNIGLAANKQGIINQALATSNIMKVLEERMYSEEEVLNILKLRDLHERETDDADSFIRYQQYDEWFEQFKKK